MSAENPPAVYDPEGLPGWNAMYDSRPRDILETVIEVDVVGRRCVYLNRYRIAGGKPYVSENLPSHILKATLGAIINAFPEEQILAAYAQQKAQRAKLRAEVCRELPVGCSASDTDRKVTRI